MADNKKSDDYVIYGPSCCDEHHAAPCVRSRDGQAEMGLIRPFVEGEQPVEGAELVRLERLGPGVARITEVISGPAMVNSQEYRDNWDTIFGGKQTVGEA